MTTQVAPTTQAVRPADAGAADPLAGTWNLTRLALRVDRIRLPAWVIAVGGSTVLLASSYQTLYPTAESRQARAALIESPAATALAGPGYGLSDYTLGAMVANEIAGMTMIAVAIMSVLLVTLHLRTEEETGRAEMLRSGVVGRFAPITSGLAVVLLANLAIGLILGLGLTAVGLPALGSWNLAAGVFMVGLAFGATSALFSQVTEHARTASGLGLVAVAVAYLLRAVGDVRAKEDGSVWSWLSPIGWAQSTRAYVDERWWPLLLGLAAVVVGVVLAYLVVGRRDVGAGLVAPRGGRPRASGALSGITALTVRMQRNQIAAWAIGVAALAFPIGALGQQVADFVNQDPRLADLLPGGEGNAAQGAFALYLVFLAIMACMYAMTAVQSARGEETSGRAEDVLASPVSRWRWLGAQLAVISVATSLIVLAAGAAMGITAAATLHDGSMFGRLVGSAANFLPATLTVIALTAAVYAWFPRLLAVVWVYLGYALVIGMFLEVLPDWTGWASPFHFTPNLPADEFDVVPLIVLLAIAAALYALALLGFRRRDIQS
ncbi:ABC transporter permease [Prescottella equi]|uniref:ABC transporter permease n=1 Tax=Rhodococcus hoagii TaxID=43767 RepID=UPI000A0F88BD|nr:anibiotic ABC transporter [Prescottella equi]MBM4519717.1 anibiotic ABC transporter [Prescottella equi]MBM4528959.1 anibiotic ABC transporter [Prescottella equi]MBM4545343.1 anibiotic ABC transporter [Prescottella equi]MBM4555014.1 anibiotic ABC transporter [Prescottella equi]MBM4572112.1 anibiotic ABC transporter [Prescottella equi]